MITKRAPGLAIPVVISTLLIALILMVVPLPRWLFYFWPDWVGLVLAYWALMFPQQTTPFRVLLVALCAEVLFVKNFGVLGIGLVPAIFFIASISQQMKAMSIWTQVVIVAVAMALSKLIAGWVSGLVGDFEITLEYWYSIIGDVLIWPFLYIALNELRRVTRI
jgi:rod shape-determining protein MreD